MNKKVVKRSTDIQNDVQLTFYGIFYFLKSLWQRDVSLLLFLQTSKCSRSIPIWVCCMYVIITCHRGGSHSPCRRYDPKSKSLTHPLVRNICAKQWKNKINLNNICVQICVTDMAKNCLWKCSAMHDSWMARLGICSCDWIMYYIIYEVSYMYVALVCAWTAIILQRLQQCVYPF